MIEIKVPSLGESIQEVQVASWLVKEGDWVDVDQDIPHIAADFLFQKIVAVRHIAWENLGRMENMENGDSTPETAAVEGSKVPERAKRFLTFGIKRVAIPEEEIREYLISRSYQIQLIEALKDSGSTAALSPAN